MHACQVSSLSKVLFQTAWATVVHMSYEGSGMKLRDLARGSSSPTSFMPALHIIWSRFRNRGADRRSRNSYECVTRSSSATLFSHCRSKRPWSLFLGLFAILAILGPMLPFIFGRIIVIETSVHVRATDLLLVFPNLRTEPTQHVPRSFDRWRLIRGGP